MMKRLLAAGILTSTLLVGFGAVQLVAHADDDHGQGQMQEQGQKKEAHAVGSTLEVHISDDGKVIVRGAKVTGVSGNTITAVTAWGSVNMSWAIATDAGTEFVRRFNGKSGISEVSVGDFVSFQGMLDTTIASPVTVKARVVKDWSIQKVNATFSGTVQSADPNAQSFVFNTDARGALTVFVTSSTKIMKGDAVAVFADIVAGAKATAQGVWDTVAHTLQAAAVKIRSEVVRTTLEGKIKTTDPFVITVNDKDYTVHVASDTSILNVLWLKVPFANFKAGDGVRVYGAVKADATIDATVVRDVSLK